MPTPAENIATAFETFKASALTEFNASPDASIAADTWPKLLSIAELLTILARFAPSEPRTRTMIAAALAPEE